MKMKNYEDYVVIERNSSIVFVCLTDKGKTFTV